MFYVLLFTSVLIFILLEDCNIEIKINPYLFLILRVSEKNQKKLYVVLKEKFEDENIKSRRN